jgi:hypothetical protein
MGSGCYITTVPLATPGFLSVAAAVLFYLA